MNTFKAVGLAVLPFCGGTINGILFGPRRNDPNDWYNKLIKPAYNPPGWVFGPVWTVLYCAMGYSSYRILTLPDTCDIKLPMVAYGSQLVLNMAWTPIFFGLHQMTTVYTAELFFN